MPILMKLLGQKEVEMNSRGTTLRRSRSNRIVAGVCGGLQDFFGLDAFWFRLGFVLAMIPGGIPGIAVYLILWLIMPGE
jgi:phage shock protein C